MEINRWLEKIIDASIAFLMVIFGRVLVKAVSGVIITIFNFRKTTESQYQFVLLATYLPTSYKW